MNRKPILVIIIAGLILVGCGGDSGKTKSQSSSKLSVSSSSSKTEFVQMLHEYGDILDDYAGVMKKMSAGDMSAMSEMMSYTDRIMKWTEKWTEKLDSAQDDLSASDLADLMKEYQRLLEKFQKIASSM